MKTKIKLSRPYDYHGQTYTEIEMREPLVEDQLALAAMKGSDAGNEIKLFANLCEQPPEFFHKLPLKDFIAIQTAFKDFLD